MYQDQSTDELWLAGRNSSRKAIRVDVVQKRGKESKWKTNWSCEYEIPVRHRGELQQNSTGAEK